MIISGTITSIIIKYKHINSEIMSYEKDRHIESLIKQRVNEKYMEQHK